LHKSDTWLQICILKVSICPLIQQFVGDFQIIKKLVIFMNKFHLIQQKSDLTPKEEIQDFVKQNPNKVLYF